MLQSIIKDTFPNEKRSKLVNVCATRWVERIDALEVFEDLFEPLIISLDYIANNIDGTWNGSGNYMADAEGLCKSLCSFDSIMALVIFYKTHHSSSSNKANGFCAMQQQCLSFERKFE